jgi:hypothetical protein
LLSRSCLVNHPVKNVEICSYPFHPLFIAAFLLYTQLLNLLRSPKNRSEPILNDSEIGIWTSENFLVCSGKVHKGKAAITVWGDNEQTKLIDGAIDFEDLKAMLFDKESVMSYKIDFANIRSLRTDQNIDNLTYNSEDIILAKSVNNTGYSTNEMMLTCKPNPTTGETVIEYSIETDSFVSIKLYSMSGQLIRILTESENISGLHTLNFNGSNLANGVYNLQMFVDGLSVNRLLVVSR